MREAQEGEVIERHTVIKLLGIITSKRKFLLCPKCEKEGRINVLGEITGGGDFEVLRFHSSKTVIRAREFEVICGYCGSVVYCRLEGRDETK